MDQLVSWGEAGAIPDDLEAALINNCAGASVTVLNLSRLLGSEMIDIYELMQAAEESTESIQPIVDRLDRLQTALPQPIRLIRSIGNSYSGSGSGIALEISEALIPAILPTGLLQIVFDEEAGTIDYEGLGLFAPDYIEVLEVVAGLLAEYEASTGAC